MDGADAVVRVLRVGFGTEFEEYVVSQTVQTRHLVADRRLVGERVYVRQLGLNGIVAACVNRLLVHAGEIVVADFLLNGAPLCAAIRSVLEDAAEYKTVSLPQHFARPPRCAVGRDGIAGQPAPASVLVEVRARVGSLVDRGRIGNWGGRPRGRVRGLGTDGDHNARRGNEISSGDAHR